MGKTRGAAWGVVVGLLAPGAAAEELEVEVVAATATQAPGFGAGVTTEDTVGDGAVLLGFQGQDGSVVWTANLKGPGVTGLVDDLALLVQRPDGAVQTIARRGDQAPGAPAGAVWHGFTVGGVGADGSVAFRGRLDWKSGAGGVTTENDHGLWLWRPDGTTTLVAREGMGLPAAPSVVLAGTTGTPTPPVLLPRVAGAALAFRHDVVVPPGSGVFVAVDGTAGLLAGTASAAVGPLGGELFGGSSQVPVLDGAGRVAFRGQLAQAPGGAQVHAGNDTALFGPGPSGDLQVLAREGDPAPGGGSYQDLPSGEPLSIATDGRVTFRARVQLAGQSLDGIWKADPSGGVEPVLLEGDPAPGGGTVASVVSVGCAPDGRLAYCGNVALPDGAGGTETRRALYGPGEAGDPVPVAVEGEPAPGCEGAVFGQPNTGFLLDAAGEVVFASPLYGAVTPLDDWAVFIHTPGKGTRLLLREGHLVEVAPGDVRTLVGGTLTTTFGAGANGHDGRWIGLTDQGHVALTATFLEPATTPGTTVNAALLRLRLVEGEEPVGGEDTGGVGADAGSTDAGEWPDAGADDAASDGGPWPMDAGAGADAAEPMDAGAGADAASDGGAGPDAADAGGVADSGAGSIDTHPEQDSAPGTADAHAAQPDAASTDASPGADGNTAADAGADASPTPTGGSGGTDCSTAAGGPPTPLLLALAALLAARSRRRRGALLLLGALALRRRAQRSEFVANVPTRRALPRT